MTVQSDYDGMAQVYDRVYQDSQQVQVENRALKRFLLAHNMLEGHVLDLGCGTGLALDFGANPSKYVGLDISQGMLDLFEKKYPGVKVLHADMDELHDTGIAEGAYDRVISVFGGISYVHNPQRLFNEVNYILASGGKAYLMGYAVRWGFGQNTCTEGNGILSYRLLYTPTLIRGLAERARFRKVTLHPFSLFPEVLGRADGLVAQLAPRFSRYIGVLVEK